MTSPSAARLIPADPSKVMVIRDVTPDVVTLSTPFSRFGHLKIGGRGTIVRLQSGALAVFSPVALTEEVQAKIKSLGGNVQYLAALDIEHHIFLTPWKKAFPQAKIFAPEGLPEKRERDPATKGLEFNYVFTKANRKDMEVSEEFDREFEVEYVYAHANHELVFFHKPSKTMIEADFLFNLPATEQYSKAGVPANTGFLTRLFVGINHAKPPATWQKRLLWYAVAGKDRKGFASSVVEIDKWDFERIIPCHGDVIEGNGKTVFGEVMQWFLELSKK